MTKLQKNNKDIYYHNLIQRLQKTSAIVSHIVGLENITGDITQIPIINEWYNQMNDNLPFEFTNLLEALPQLLNQLIPFGLVNVTYDELLTKENKGEHTDTLSEYGWTWHDTPPQEYLEWLEELKRQEEEINNEIENII